MTRASLSRPKDRLGLSSLWNLARLLYFKWALAEIHPLHPDVPYLAHRIAELEEA